jgi:HSP20 family protein
MEQLFEQMRRSMSDDWTMGGRGIGLPAMAGDAGDANLTLERTDESYLVMADVPGFERDEIDLRFANGRLFITAVHEDGDEESFRSRRMEESVMVSDDVLVDEITATYRNGVLEVELPVEEPVEDSHHIDIE